jgi:hypothetical protein
VFCFLVFLPVCSNVCHCFIGGMDCIAFRH